VPKLTVAPLRNPVPVMVTTVPPANGPDAGDILVTDGAGGEYVNPLLNDPDELPPLLTETVTAPGLPAGVVAVNVVLLTN